MGGNISQLLSFRSHLIYVQGKKDLPMSLGEPFTTISLVTFINILLLVTPVDSRSSESQAIVNVLRIFFISSHVRLRTKKGIWSVYVSTLML